MGFAVSKRTVALSNEVRNRVTNPHLGLARIEIVHRAGVLGMDSNEITALIDCGGLADLNGFDHLQCDAGGTGDVLVFRAREVTLNLSKSALIQLVLRNLTAMRYFVLRERFGDFYEICEDFYCPETGRASSSRGFLSAFVRSGLVLPPIPEGRRC